MCRPDSWYLQLISVRDRRCEWSSEVNQRQSEVNSLGRLYGHSDLEEEHYPGLYNITAFKKS
jgi:hypothetical protein